MDLTQIRKLKGFTLKEVGRYIGMSESGVSSIFTCRRKLSFNKAFKLSHLFDMTLEEIFLAYNSSIRRKKGGENNNDNSQTS